MPKIERAQRRQSIPGSGPGVPRSISAATQGARTVAGLADTAGEVAEGIGRAQDKVAADETRVRTAVGQIRNRIETEERHYSALRMGNEVTESALNFEQDRLAIQGTDAYNSMEAVDEWETNQRMLHLDGMEDRELSRDVEGHIAAKSLSLKGSLSRHEAKQRDLVAEDTRQTTLRGSLKSAYMGSGTLEENLQAYNVAIANDPRLRDTDKENKLVAGQSVIASARLEGLIDRNPDAAIGLMDSGLFNEFLTADALSAFNKKAHQASKAREKDAKAQVKETRRVAKEELAAERQETGKEFRGLLYDGKLTHEKVGKSNLAVREGPNSMRAWDALIDERAEKIKKLEAEARDAVWETNPAVEASLTNHINLNPTRDHSQAISDAHGKGLSTDDAKKMQAYADKLRISDPLKAEAARTATKQLDGAKTADLFSDNEGENLDKWAEATNQLTRFIVNNPDGDPAEFVDQLLETEKIGFWENLFDGISKEEHAATRRKKLEREAGPQIGDPPETLNVPEGATHGGRNPDTNEMEYFDANGAKL